MKMFFSRATSLCVLIQKKMDFLMPNADFLCDTAMWHCSFTSHHKYKYENKTKGYKYISIYTHIFISMFVYIKKYSYIFSVQKKGGWYFLLVGLFFA